MADVFIGYAREDRAKAVQLAQVLEAQGWSVCWDVYIPAGKTFDEVIAEALAQARCIVVLLSKASVTKHWVKTEAERGRKRNILVPVLLDEVELPIAFELIQAAPLIGWQGEPSHLGVARLLQDIAAIVGPPPIKKPKDHQEKETLEPRKPKTDDFFSIIGKVVMPVAAVAIAAFIMMWFIQPPPNGTTHQAESEKKEVVSQPPAETTKAAVPAESKTQKPKVPRIEKVVSAPSFSVPKQMPIEITGKDGAPMVLVPAGEFTMGSSDGENDEKPVHRVSLDAFYLDKYEVTNKLFQKFSRETGYETTAEKEGKAYGYTSSGEWKEISGANWRKPEGGETVFVSNRDEHPVVSMSWYDAEAYCRWAGKRLPTEAEFEYANRGGTQTTYWWGDSNPGSRRVANIADEAGKRQFSGWSIMAGYDDGYVRTAPVGSFDPNPFGLYDTTGNVWEWTADWYGKDYYERSPSRNPTGPSHGEYRVLRGGSWSNEPGYVRSADRGRSQPMNRSAAYGFRCAKIP